MMGGLLPLGHFFLFFLVCLVATQSQGDPRCLEADKMLREGDRTVIHNETSTWHGVVAVGVDVYLWPEEGFMGVGVRALTDTGTPPAAWFSKDSLFPDANTAGWWKLWVWVNVYGGSDPVEFRVRLGDSVKACHSLVTVNKLVAVEVVGYGPSRWRTTEPPPGCHYQEITPRTWPPNPPTCTAPPPTPQPTTSPPCPQPTTSAASPLEVAGVVIVVFGVVLAAFLLAADIYEQRLLADQKAA